MASKKKSIRTLVRLKSTKSDHVYYTEKNRRNNPTRVEIKKYDPVVQRHVLYKESK
jgi:large subunit ribosomal protein L33